jgi:hypothetical protein
VVRKSAAARRPVVGRDRWRGAMFFLGWGGRLLGKRWGKRWGKDFFECALMHWHGGVGVTPTPTATKNPAREWGASRPHGHTGTPWHEAHVPPLRGAVAREHAAASKR